MSAAIHTDDLLLRLTRAVRGSGLTRRERGILLGVLAQAKRGGPEWEPSPKQRMAALRILEDLGELASPGPALIDHD